MGTPAPRIDLHRVRVVSWDLDGTLYERRGLAGWLVAAALAGPRGGWRELVELRRWHGEAERARAAGGRYDGPPPRRAALEDRWYLPGLRRLGPRAGIREAIDAFVARGLARHVVVSDYAAEGKLEALGLAGRFAAVHEGERIGWLKPAPALYRTICEREGIDGDSLLHIGDREATDGGARAIGAQVVIVPRRGPVDLSEIVAFLGGPR